MTKPQRAGVCEAQPSNSCQNLFADGLPSNQFTFQWLVSRLHKAVIPALIFVIPIAPLARHARELIK
jgi:hypothetical protein